MPSRTYTGPHAVSVVQLRCTSKGASTALTVLPVPRQHAREQRTNQDNLVRRMQAQRAREAATEAYLSHCLMFAVRGRSTTLCHPLLCKSSLMAW
eukprot:scaffold6422_cov350-Prasinococcus_capsulatus_cf.AAC.8